MYKRPIIYITIFLIFCVATSWISNVADNSIMQWYVIDLKSELKEVFLSNDNFYIDGVMLSIYLYDSLEPFVLNNQFYDYFKGSEQYNEIKSKSFRVEKVEDQGYYNITEDYSGTNIKLSSLNSMNRAIIIRKIMTNLVTITVGAALWFIYNKQRNIKTYENFREIPIY